MTKHSKRYNEAVAKIDPAAQYPVAHQRQVDHRRAAAALPVAETRRADGGRRPCQDDQGRRPPG